MTEETSKWEADHEAHAAASKGAKRWRFLEVARRFVLGKQGLCPGRRWRGLSRCGTGHDRDGASALDPLRSWRARTSAARTGAGLHARELANVGVRGAKFSIGADGWPFDRCQLPLLAPPHAPRTRSRPRWQVRTQTTPPASRRCAACFREQKTVRNREFTTGERKGQNSDSGRRTARSRSTTSGAPAVMTHHRERFRRVYARTEVGRTRTSSPRPATTKPIASSS